MQFDIIRRKEERTLGWKAEINGTWYGAYVMFDEEPTDEKLRLFASSILFFIDYPENYRLEDGTKPQPLGGK